MESDEQECSAIEILVSLAILLVLMCWMSPVGLLLGLKLRI